MWLPTWLFIETVIALSTIVISVFLWNYIRSPLKMFPGPIATNFTNVWRLLDVYRGHCHFTHLELHRRHGSAVRMGPNILSLSDPKLIRQVFRTKEPWKKSPMYSVKEPIINGIAVPNLFSTKDENWHSVAVRPIIPLYSMTKLLGLEHLMDNATDLLLKKLGDRFACTGNICDLSKYLLYFSWDSMSEITFGEDLGILEAGNDVNGLLATSAQEFDYFASISQIPQLDQILAKNPVYPIGPSNMEWAVTLAVESYRNRESQGPSKKRDFLTNLLEIKKKHSEIVDDDMVVAYLLNNLIAGSDTTANLLSAVVYYVLKNPSVHERLRKECMELTVPVTWKASQELPYLKAVMQESMRIHPGVGMMLERVVPDGGLVLSDGRFVPQGTIIGMNPWVIGHDEAILGPETDRFIPERWLKQNEESKEQYQQRCAKMKAADLGFGFGKRICTVKYLAQLESYKLIAALFATFDISLTNPGREWKVRNSWFVRNEDVSVFLRQKKNRA